MNNSSKPGLCIHGNDARTCDVVVDTADYLTAPEMQPISCGELFCGKSKSEGTELKWRHHKNCAKWTVTTDGNEKGCDCAQAGSVFKGTSEAAGEGVPERVNCGTLPDHIWVHPWRELLYYSPTDQPDYVEFARVSPVTVGEAARRLAEKIIDADYVDADGELGRDAAIEEVARIVTSELSADANEAAELKQAVRDYFNIDPAENAAEWCAASSNLLRLVGLPVDHAPAPRAPDVGAEGGKL